MEQDLFDWLNSQRESQGKGLLVAPLSPERPDMISVQPEDDLPPENPPEPAPVPQQEQDQSQENQEPQDGISDSDSPEEVPDVIPENHEDTSEAAPAESQQEVPSLPPEAEPIVQESDDESSAYTPESQEPEPEPAHSESEPQDDEPSPEDDITQSLPPEAWSYGDDEPDTDPAEQTHDWQERATGFTLSLDEPPPELWTNINDDDTELDYEPTDSLQGAAYVQIHGRNFTERLHHTLKHRKERAQERLNYEHETDNSHPYVQKAVILCATLLMALGFACLALMFIRRETPEGMKSRALSLIQEGKFEEASQIYRRAHRRYPDVPEFLEGLSETSQKLGHVQTAKAAHDEYIRQTSHDTQAQSRTDVPAAIPKPEPKTPPKPAPVSLILNEKPLTFDDCMSEANHAYNIGMYTRALEYFSRAMKLNPSDSRPYIGLSASYRMKGWYVDSMNILDEMRRKFGRSPALDMETYFLREAK